MSTTETIVEKTIRIKLLSHIDGNLIIAVSEDLPGFSVVGKTPEEIEIKLTEAMRDFLQFSGKQVVSLELVRDERLAAPNFGPPAFIAHASLTCDHPA